MPTRAGRFFRWAGPSSGYQCACAGIRSPPPRSVKHSSVEGLRDFLAAVKMAQKHRDTVATIQDPDEVLEEVLERVATKPEVEQLLERIRQLEAKGSIKK